MEHRDECPTCADVSQEPVGGWSRRSLLRLGVAAGIGAATVNISPAFAGTVGAADHEVDAPGAAFATARAPQPNWPAPPIVTRAQWGCNEALRKPGHDVQQRGREDRRAPHGDAEQPGRPRRGGAVGLRVQRVGRVHRHRVPLPHRSARAHLRRSLGPRRIRRAFRTPARTSLHDNVQGAATLGHNPRTIAVAMLGTFTDISPTSAALEALVDRARVEVRALGHRSAAVRRRTRTPTAVWRCSRTSSGTARSYATICPGDPIIARLDADPRPGRRCGCASGTFGYWIAGANGRDPCVRRRARRRRSATARRLSVPIRAIVAHPSRPRVLGARHRRRRVHVRYSPRSSARWVGSA